MQNLGLRVTKCYKYWTDTVPDTDNSIALLHSDGKKAINKKISFK